MRGLPRFSSRVDDPKVTTKLPRLPEGQRGDAVDWLLWVAYSRSFLTIDYLTMPISHSVLIKWTQFGKIAPDHVNFRFDPTGQNLTLDAELKFDAPEA